MKLKSSYGSMDDVPEELKESVALDSKTGQYVLIVESTGGKTPNGDPFLFENAETGGLKAVLDSERAENKANKSKLAEFGDITPAEATRNKNDAAKFATYDPESEADKIAQAKTETALAAQKEQHDAVAAQFSAQIEGLTGFVKDNLLVAEAKRELANFMVGDKKVAANEAFLLDKLLGRMEFSQTQGDNGGYDFGYKMKAEKGGEYVVVSDGRSIPGTPAHLIAEWYADPVYAPAFGEPAPTGGNSHEDGLNDDGGRTPVQGGDAPKAKSTIPGKGGVIVTDDNLEGLASGEISVDFTR